MGMFKAAAEAGVATGQRKLSFDKSLLTDAGLSGLAAGSSYLATPKDPTLAGRMQDAMGRGDVDGMMHTREELLRSMNLPGAAGLGLAHLGGAIATAPGGHWFVDPVIQSAGSAGGRMLMSAISPTFGNSRAGAALGAGLGNFAGRRASRAIFEGDDEQG